MTMQLLLKAGLRQILKVVMPICSPKAAADCSKVLLLIRAKRNLQMPLLDIAGNSLVTSICSVNIFTLMALT